MELAAWPRRRDGRRTALPWTAAPRFRPGGADREGAVGGEDRAGGVDQRRPSARPRPSAGPPRRRSAAAPRAAKSSWSARSSARAAGRRRRRRAGPRPHRPGRRSLIGGIAPARVAARGRRARGASASGSASAPNQSLQALAGADQAAVGVGQRHRRRRPGAVERVAQQRHVGAGSPRPPPPRAGAPRTSSSTPPAPISAGEEGRRRRSGRRPPRAARPPSRRRQRRTGRAADRAGAAAGRRSETEAALAILTRCGPAARASDRACCPGAGLKAAYQGSRLRTTAARCSDGECGSVSSRWQQIRLAIFAPPDLGPAEIEALVAGEAVDHRRRRAAERMRDRRHRRR